MKIYALFMLVVVAVGCGRQTALNEAEQIGVWFPAGSSVTDVRRIMEQHGFQCVMLTNRNGTLPDTFGALSCSQRSSNYFRYAFVTVDNAGVAVRMHTMTNSFK
jgi:hypothetical protein